MSDGEGTSTTGPGSDAPAPGDHEPVDGEPSFMGRFARELVQGQVLLVTGLAVVTALLLGAVLIALSDEGVREALGYFFDRPSDTFTRSWDVVSAAYAALFQGAFGSPRAWSETLVAATPLILTGLAVALPFRAALFNIGAEGQFLVGALLGGLAGFGIEGLPLVIHLPLVLLAGVVGGFVWGFIPGILKATTGAHEVIVTIMLNSIAVFLGDYLLTTEVFLRPGRADPISKVLESSAQLPRLFGFRFHVGFFVALAAAALVWWLINRSTYGFEVNAVGSNPQAALTAGMRPPRVYWSVMAVGGGLAGLGGIVQLSGVQRSLAPGFAGGLGFDGITVALLGRGNAGGVVWAALLFGALKAGGLRMQAETGTAIDLVVVIQALIIIFIAAPALVRAIYRVPTPDTLDTGSVAKGWGA